MKVIFLTGFIRFTQMLYEMY